MTTIEQLTMRYINTLNHQPKDRRDACLAMLAVMQDLRDYFEDAEPRTANVLGVVIQEHVSRETHD